MGNRRRFERKVVNSPVYVSLGQTSAGIMFNLSEGGLAVDVVGPPVTSSILALGFGMPDTDRRIEADAKVVWTDPSGQRTGLRFTELPKSAQRHIKQWVSRGSVAAVGQEDATNAFEASVLNRLQVPVTPRETARQAAPAPPGTGNPPAPEGDQELLAGLRSAVAQAEVAKPRKSLLLASEQPGRRRQHHRTLILAGVSAALALAAGVAGIVLYHSHGAQIRAELSDFKSTIASIFGWRSSAPSGATTSRATKPRPRPQRRSESKSDGQAGSAAKSEGQPAGVDQASSSSALLPGRPGAQAKQAPPFQVEVVDPQNQRHIVTPRGSTNLRLRFQAPNFGKGGAGAPAAGGVEAASLAGSAAPKAQPGRVLGETSGDVPTRQTMPVYPLVALQQNLQGRVVVQVLISKEGAVQNVRLVSGPPLLASAVVDAVKQWRYKPFYENGVPVEADRRITVDFFISTE